MLCGERARSAAFTGAESARQKKTERELEVLLLLVLRVRAFASRERALKVMSLLCFIFTKR
jgi:hypothetical protein